MVYIILYGNEKRMHTKEQWNSAITMTSQVYTGKTPWATAIDNMITVECSLKCGISHDHGCYASVICLQSSVDAGNGVSPIYSWLVSVWPFPSLFGPFLPLQLARGSVRKDYKIEKDPLLS